MDDLDAYGRLLLLEKRILNLEKQLCIATNALSQIVEVAQDPYVSAQDRLKSIIDVSLDSQDKVLEIGKLNAIIFGLGRRPCLPAPKRRIRDRIQKRLYRKCPTFNKN